MIGQQGFPQKILEAALIRHSGYLRFHALPRLHRLLLQQELSHESLQCFGRPGILRERLLVEIFGFRKALLR